MKLSQWMNSTVAGLCLVLLSACSALASAPSPSAKQLAQRQLYAQAQDALQADDYATFKHLKARLHDYPLYRYLQYAELKSQLGDVSRAQVEHFLQQYPDSYLSGYMRGLWLHELARRQQWRAFLRRYKQDQRSDKSLACHAVQAQIQLGALSKPRLRQLAEEKYLVNFSQPSACDPVFAWLEAQGGISNQLRGQRVALVLDARNWRLARALSKQLTGAPARHYQAWQAIRRKPEAILQRRYVADTAEHRELALYAVNRVLAGDLHKAEQLWAQLQQRYRFAPQARLAFSRRLAIRSAQRHHDDALARLLALPQAAVNADVRAWRVRAALREQNWQAVQQQILAMTPAEQAQDEWLYWRARAEMQLGNAPVAQLAYQRLAGQRGYYSFLAAERLGQHYAYTPDSPAADARVLRALQTRPALQRVRELLAQRQFNYARVEWARAIRDFDAAELLSAAQLAHHWQWHEQAIRIASKLGHYDDLDLRFAMPHRRAVESHAAAAGIDPNWVQAIMRRESAYAEDARSSVGARGLMQLMPATARHVARQQGWPWQGVAQLNQAATNIRYGAAYLAELSEELGETLGDQLGGELGAQIPLVSAAYNAGPSRVKKWLPKAGALPADIWIDTIPFAETRQYVRAVSEYMSVFTWRSQGQPARPAPHLDYTRQQVGGTWLAANQVKAAGI